MKTEDIAILGAAALAVFLIVKGTKGGASGSTDLGSFSYTYTDAGGTHFTPDPGVSMGSLFNTGIGGGYISDTVKAGSLFNTGIGGGYPTSSGASGAW